MKRKLMIQSLSPLALLTIIRNFNFITLAGDGSLLSTTEFLQVNMVLLFVMGVSFLWVMVSVLFYLDFLAFKWSGKKGGFEIRNLEEKEEASLNFFLTLIIPLLIDDLYRIQSAVSFLLVVVMICILLSRTSLFYANPILLILGYRVFEFEFLENSKHKGRCIGIAREDLKEVKCIEYKKISGDILFVKGMKNTNERR